jgi:hypothetical protein
MKRGKAMHKGFAKFLLFAALGCVICFPSFSAEPTAPQTGQELLPYLQIFASFDLTKPPIQMSLSPEQAHNSIWTDALIAGIFEAVRMQADRDQRDVSCMEVSFAAKQKVARVAIYYIDSHSEARLLPPIAVIYTAIGALYPCIQNPAKNQ